MAAENSRPSNEAFPNKTSTPKASQIVSNSPQDKILDARQTYLEANGYSVDRTTGAVTAV